MSQLVLCISIYNGYFGAALSFVGYAMINTWVTRITWAKEKDAYIKSFSSGQKKHYYCTERCP